MERRAFVTSSTLGALGLASSTLEPVASLFPDPRPAPTATRKILIAGGDFNTVYIRYTATLTGKPRPRICYLPTASADNPGGIIDWYQQCSGLDVVPFVQRSFINSYDQHETFADVLLSMDAIVVSGGSTLNQQAIWKAQGIDEVLREAWNRGIVLGGASAGSLCWFEEGTTDSRPKELSTVQCLGFLKGSHCPHYDKEAPRRPLYLKLVGSGGLKPGYAVDNDAGLYFEGTEVKRAVTSRTGAKIYYVSRVGDTAVEKVMEPELLT
ncbi:MAG TPA: peptidase E [Gemmatimonadaceae bacterium]|jgi:dipeptidase E|nr:peptidase E [Gemmatimonadaceae bacterium]